MVESLEDRRLLNVDWRNPVDSIDVDSDGSISPLDALVIINSINAGGSGPLPAVHDASKPYLDVDGDQSVSPLDVLSVINHINALGSGSRTIRESAGVLVQESDIAITLGQSSGSRHYRVKLDVNIDKADASSQEDLVAVYLVNPSNPTTTLLDRGVQGTSLFSWNGTQAEYAIGRVGWQDSILDINLSDLKDIHTALLKVQLINHDHDSNSKVTITPLANTVDESITPDFIPQTANVATPAPTLDLSQLASNTTLSLETQNARYSKSNGVYEIDARVINRGPSVGRNVAVVFNSLPSGVTVLNASGTTTTGSPYINFQSAIARGGLATNDRSELITIRIRDTSGVQFSLTNSLLSAANHAPNINAIAPISTKPGDVLRVRIPASDIDGDGLTYDMKFSGNSLPTRVTADGYLEFRPDASDIGNYSLDVLASDGLLVASRSLTVNVVADPLSTTRVSGKVLKVDSTPIVGMRVDIGNVQVLTQSDGSFSLDLGTGTVASDTIKVRGDLFVGAVGYPFIAEKIAFLLEHPLLSHLNNVISRPIFLPAIDRANGMQIDPTQNTTLTTNAIPGASVFIAAGSLVDLQGTPYAGKLSITEVPVELTPAALPKNLRPDLVVTIQPGDMVFATPAKVTLPNRSGRAPGSPMNLWAVNPTIGEFEIVGTMVVSADGKTIETVTGGVRYSSWEFAAPPVDQASGGPESYESKKGCEDSKLVCPINSVVENYTGAVIETHETVSYQSQGVSRGVTLVYDSLRADPRPIVHFRYDAVSYDEYKRIVAGASVTGEDYYKQFSYFFDDGRFASSEAFWSIPKSGGTVDAAMQFDMRTTPTGLYSYQLDTGILNASVSQGGTINNSGVAGTTSTKTGSIVHVNTIDSPFGAGWGIAGLQKLYVSGLDGSVLLVDGDGSELSFGPGLTSPAGDFSHLAIQGDGTYTRTLKEQTVYAFDRQNRLSTVTDRNGNRTTYAYTAEGLLQSITDAVGLQTLFAYTNGKLQSITDPAQRVTRFSVDAAGNLQQITDPDNSSRQWQYDGKHHQVVEIDKRGNREETFFDFAGRASGSRRADGTTIRINPAEVRGLYPNYSNANNAPVANFIGEAVSQYTTANGNTVTSFLDRFGQVIKSFDSLGNLPKDAVNANNLVTSHTDARGNITLYKYDAQGNLTSIEDAIANTSQIVNEFTQPGERHTYKFHAAAGTRLFASRLITTSGGEYFELHGPDGRLLKKYLPNTSLEWPPIILPMDGEYRLEGSIQFGIDIGVAHSLTSTYRFGLLLDNNALVVQPGQLAVPVELEPNEAKMFRRQGTAGEKFFAISDLSSVSVRLFAPDQREIYLNQGSVTIPESGSYLIVISNSSTDKKSGSLTITSTLPASTNLSGLNQVYSGSLASDESKEFLFRAPAGHPIRIDSRGDNDILSWIVSPSGEDLGVSYSTLVLPESGEYRLVAKNYDSSNSHTYNLQVVDLAASASELKENTALPVSVAPYRSVFLWFDGLIDQRIFFDAPNLMVSVESVTAYPASVVDDIATLPRTGRYYVKLNNPSGDIQNVSVKRKTLTSITLPEGTSASGDVPSDGSPVVYRFDGIQGDRFRFHDLGGARGGRWYVLDPNGNIVYATNSYGLGNSLPDFNVGFLPVTGVYSLILTTHLTGALGTSVPYHFEWLRQKITTLPMSLGTTVTGHVDRVDDKVEYSLDLQAGQQIFLDGIANNSSGLKLWMYSPSGQPLMLNYGYYSPGPENDVVTLPIHESGTYRVSVYGDWGDGYTGDYSFRILDVAQSLALPFNQPVSYVLQPDHKAVPMTFIGHVGQKVRLNVTTSNGTIYYNLYDSMNKPVSSVTNNSEVLLTSEGRYMLVNQGDLRPGVDPPNTVTITMSDISDAPVSNTGLNTLQSGTLAAGQVKTFNFTAGAGTRLLWDNHLAESTGVSVSIFDPANQRVGEFQIGSTSYNWFRLVSSGTYRVEIHGFTPQSAGAYKFRLLDIDTAATPITLDQIVQGNITANDRSMKLFQFETQPGQSFLVDQFETGWGYGIWSPDGFRTASIPQLTYAGKHILYIPSWEPSVTSFKFRVVDLNAIPLVVPSALEQGVAEPGEAKIFHAKLNKGQRFVFEVFDSQLMSVVNASGGGVGRSVQANEIVAPETGSYFFIRDFDGIRNQFPYKFRLSFPEVKTTQVADNGGSSHVPKWDYDPQFNVLTEFSDALGHITQFQRDNRGNLSKIVYAINALGGTDDLTISITVNFHGLPDLITDVRGAVTDYDYDASDRVIRVTQAKGTSLQTSDQFEYDTAGNITATIDGRGNRTTYRYDVMNRLIEVISADPDGAGPLLPLSNKTEYDPSGNPVKLTNSLGNAQTLEYDARNRLTRSIDAQNGSTSYQYDTIGNVIGMTDALGRETLQKYDLRSRVVQQIGPDGNRTQFKYDVDNNMIGLIDELGNETRLAFDLRNRLMSETDSLGATKSFEYDVADQLVKQVDRNGRSTTYTYDDLAQRISETWKSSSGQTVNTIQYTYDASGNVMSIKDTFDELNFEYDLLNRMTRETSGGIQGIPASDIIHSYDLTSNRLTTQDTIGGIAGGLLTSSFDALNRVVRITQSGAHVSSQRIDLGYDPGDRLSSIRRYTDLAGSQLVATSTSTYDSLDRLTLVRHATSSDITIDSFASQYDAAGQTTRMTEKAGTIQFVYNPNGELTSTTSSNPARTSESYAYDSMGNRVTSQGQGTQNVIGKDNRLTSNAQFNFEYDAEGNRITQTDKQSDAVRRFEYDHRNRLQKVSDFASATASASKVTTFRYDALDRRVSQKVDSNPGDAVDGVTAYYIYSDEDIIAEWVDPDGAGTAPAAPSMRYLHGPDIDQIFSQETANGTVQWLLTDPIGTTRTIINSQGAVLNQLTYDSFGNLIAQTNPNVSTRYRFAGREFDSSTGLHYNRARYYDAAEGRFLSRDPISLAAGDANLYRYVGNNPVDNTDPSGLTKKAKPGLSTIGRVLKAGFETLAWAIKKVEKGVKSGKGKLAKAFGWAVTAQDAYNDATMTYNEMKLSDYQRQQGIEPLWDKVEHMDDTGCPPVIQNPNDMRAKRAVKAFQPITRRAGDKAQEFVDNTASGKAAGYYAKAKEFLNKMRGSR